VTRAEPIKAKPPILNLEQRPNSYAEYRLKVTHIDFLSFLSNFFTLGNKNKEEMKFRLRLKIIQFSQVSLSNEESGQAPTARSNGSFIFS
jgi:hypothetical protein